LFPDSDSLRGTMAEGPWSLFELLGEFWQQQLSDAELLSYHNFAKLVAAEDALLRDTDLRFAASVQTVKPYFRRQWWSIELRESGLIVEPNVIVYGGGRSYGSGIVYGQAEVTSFAWSVPSQIKSVGLVVDGILSPSKVWDLSTIDFDAATAVLRFRSNPFDDVESELIYTPDGEPLTYTDREGVVRQDRRLRLWLRNVELDENTPFLRYGAIVGVESQGTPSYPAAVEAVWSLLVQGPSLDALRRGLFASAGLTYPLGGEIVERIDDDVEGKVVVTSTAIFRGHPNAIPLVGVGDVLTRGQSVFDTVEVVDLTDPSAASGVLLGLAITPAVADVSGGVVVPDLDENWAYLGITDGYPEARFTAIGDPEDVEAFWRGVHARGVADGRTLFQHIPGFNILNPPAVNPLDFILRNALGGNVLLISLKPQHFLASEPGFMARIADLLPAGLLVLTQIALEPVADSLSLPGGAEVVDVVDTAISTPLDSISGSAAPGDPALTDYPPQVWNA
jgi:hypothetical protein